MKTVSFETAKKLKAAGWGTETQCSYFGDEYHIPRFTVDRICRDHSSINAPTLDEILEELPKRIGDNLLSVFCNGGDYMAGYYKAQTDRVMGALKSFENENLVEAAAKLWLWAKKEGYIKP